MSLPIVAANEVSVSTILSSITRIPCKTPLTLIQNFCVRVCACARARRGAYRTKNSRGRGIRAVGSSEGCADSSSRFEAERLSPFVRESADDRQEAEKRAAAVAFTIARIDDPLLNGAVHPFAARPTVRHPLIVIRKPSVGSG